MEIYVSTTALMAAAFVGGVVVGVLGMMVWAVWSYSRKPGRKQ